MTTKLANSASSDGQTVKSEPPDVRRAIFLSSKTEFAYDRLKIDGHLGNVGLKTDLETRNPIPESIRPHGLGVNRRDQEHRRDIRKPVCQGFL